MAIPTYDQFIEPLLRLLGKYEGGLKTMQVYESLAEVVGLSDDERAVRLPSGRQAVHHNRIAWAQDRLKRAGLSTSPRRGLWCLTADGKEYLSAHPAALSQADVTALATTQRRDNSSGDGGDVDRVSPAAPEHTSQSPAERIDSAIAELTDSVSAELLEMIMQSSPGFFENLVLDLLHAMDYGTSRDDLQRVGGSGDGGIDGIISLDRLGLEKVYIQAKRWRGTVGRPEIQGFYGALAGRRAHKGVFITTSSYSREAREYAESVSDSIVLVDGERLAMLMIVHGIGVQSSRTIHIPILDSDYFDDG